MSAESDDEDAELEILRAAALRSKRSLPEESAISTIASDINKIHKIELVERIPAVQVTNTQNTSNGQLLQGNSRFPGNRTNFSRDSRKNLSNLIVIQTVPFDGDKQQQKPPNRSFKKESVSLLPKSNSSSLLLRPQDRWDNKESPQPIKKKVPATKFSRYDDSNSSSESDDDNDSNSASENEDSESQEVPQLVDEGNISTVADSVNIFNCVEEVTLPTDEMTENENLIFPVCEVTNNESLILPVNELTDNEKTVLAAGESNDKLLLPVEDVTSIDNSVLNLNKVTDILALEPLKPVLQSSAVVPVVSDCTLPGVQKKSPSLHSSSSDDSFLSRSPTPIRSPLRLDAQPQHRRLPLKYDERRSDREIQRSSKSNKLISHSPEAFRYQSSVKYQPRASPKRPYRSRSGSPNRRYVSPVPRWSNTSPHALRKSRSKSPCGKFISRSPDKCETKLSPKILSRSRSRSQNSSSHSSVKCETRLSPNVLSMNRSRSRNRSFQSRSPFLRDSKLSPNISHKSRSESRNRSKSPVRYQSRLAQKEVSRKRSPPVVDYQSRFSPNESYRKRSRSPINFHARLSRKVPHRSRSPALNEGRSRSPFKLQSRSSTNVLFMNRLQSPNHHRVHSRSPVDQQFRSSPKANQRSRSRSVDRKTFVGSDIKRQSRSPQASGRLRFSDDGVGASHVPFVSSGNTVSSQSLYNSKQYRRKSISKSPDIMRSPCCTKNSRSRSRSIDRRPTASEVSPSRGNRNVRNRLGINPSYRKYDTQMPKRRSRSLSHDGNVSPNRFKSSKAESRFQSKATEISQRNKVSEQVVTRSPVHKRSRLAETNTRTVTDSAGESLRKSQLEVGSSKSSLKAERSSKDCKRSSDLQRKQSPYSKSEISSSRYTENIKPVSSKIQQRQKSSERRAHSPVSVSNKKKLQDCAIATERKCLSGKSLTESDSETSQSERNVKYEDQKLLKQPGSVIRSVQRLSSDLGHQLKTIAAINQDAAYPERSKRKKVCSPVEKSRTTKSKSVDNNHLPLKIDESFRQSDLEKHDLGSRRTEDNSRKSKKGSLKKSVMVSSNDHLKACQLQNEIIKDTVNSEDMLSDISDNDLESNSSGRKTSMNNFSDDDDKKEKSTDCDSG